MAQDYKIARNGQSLACILTGQGSSQADQVDRLHLDDIGRSDWDQVLQRKYLTTCAFLAGEEGEGSRGRSLGRERKRG